MGETTQTAQTVDQVIRDVARTLARAGVFFGHGTDNAVDEAASLAYHVAGLAYDDDAAGARVLSATERVRIAGLLERRIGERIPLPYLLNEAWFAGLSFYVDERVLIPRSPFAELIGARFEPWLAPARVRRICEIGTGSGCIAIACAFAFPGANIVATDISADALEVARVNIDRHGVAGRVSLVKTDLLDGIDGHFDLIISNPPYVPDAEARALPAEYRHEPALALGSGPDGLASTRRILQDAPRHLADGGWLAVEVGAGWPALEAAFPAVPFVWPALVAGGEGIALLDATAGRMYFD